jgi:hypothetical protein
MHDQWPSGLISATSRRYESAKCQSIASKPIGKKFYRMFFMKNRLLRIVRYMNRGVGANSFALPADTNT